MPDFECRLKKYRLLKDLTQEQLAAQVGVRRETIMRLEKAQYNPSLKLAIDIARVVEAPIEEIFVCKSFFSKVLKLLVFQGVWMFLCSQFPLFFPLPEKNKGKSYCTLSSSFAASRLASLLACA